MARQALDEFYAMGVKPDWWKLPPFTTEEGWQEVERVINEHDPWCRGIVMLGLNAPMSDLIADFALGANSPVCKGFAVGRTLFQDAAEAWFAGDIGDEAVRDQVTVNYRNLLDAWQALRTSNETRRAS